MQRLVVQCQYLDIPFLDLADTSLDDETLKQYDLVVDALFGIPGCGVLLA